MRLQKPQPPVQTNCKRSFQNFPATSRISPDQRFMNLPEKPMWNCWPVFTPHVFSLLCLLLFLGAGCRSLNTTDLQPFSQGVTAAKDQTDVSFKGVTDLTSKTIIGYAADQ